MGGPMHAKFILVNKIGSSLPAPKEKESIPELGVRVPLLYNLSFLKEANERNNSGSWPHHNHWSLQVGWHLESRVFNEYFVGYHVVGAVTVSGHFFVGFVNILGCYAHLAFP